MLGVLSKFISCRRTSPHSLCLGIASYSDFLNDVDVISFQTGATERLMRLAAAFTWEDFQNKTRPDVSVKMTNLLPLIKPATLRILIIFFGCHLCYISLRLGLGDNRPLSINAYYGFNTSISPLYEIVNVSQVFYRIK
jgi:hypothetical protein